MSRKIITSFFVVAMLMSMVAVASAADVPNANPGCYVSAPASVNEGAGFTATVKCNAGSAQVYGFQFGSALTASPLTVNGAADTAALLVKDKTATPYYDVPAEWATDVFVGHNALGLYGLSHQGTDFSTGTFDLGSYDVTTPKGFTFASNGNGFARISVSGFELSDYLGAPSTVALQSPGYTNVIINNLPIALLSGAVTIKSDGAMAALSGINLTVGPNSSVTNSTPAEGSNLSTTTNASATGNTSDAFDVGNLEYDAPDFDALNIDVNASMDSHLSCATTYNLSDGFNVASQIAASGTITLLAGDVDGISGIGIGDAAAIGGTFNVPSSDTSHFVATDDINKDGTINIFDLAAVGRNYTVITADCSGSTLTHSCFQVVGGANMAPPFFISTTIGTYFDLNSQLKHSPRNIYFNSAISERNQMRQRINIENHKARTPHNLPVRRSCGSCAVEPNGSSRLHSDDCSSG